MGDLHEEQYAFMISRWSLLGMSSVTEFIEQMEHVLCSVTVFPKPCLLWDNVEKDW